MSSLRSQTEMIMLCGVQNSWFLCIYVSPMIIGWWKPLLGQAYMFVSTNCIMFVAEHKQTLKCKKLEGLGALFGLVIRDISRLSPR